MLIFASSLYYHVTIMDNFFYKTWHSFFLLAFILLLFVGCSRKPVKYTIAVSQCSEDIWRDKLNEELK